MDGRIVSRGRGNVARCIADEWSRDSSESSFLLYFFLSLSPFSFPFLSHFPLPRLFRALNARPYANGGSIPRFQTPGPEENSNLLAKPVDFSTKSRALLFVFPTSVEFRSSILRSPLFMSNRNGNNPPSSSSSSSIPFAANNFPREEEWTVVSVRISWIYRAYGWGIKKYRVNSCQCFSLAPPPSFFLDFYPFLFLVYSDIYF